MKIIFRSIVLLALVLFARAELSNAQSTSINEDEFLKATGYESYKATAAKFPRRETWVYENFSDGKVTSSESKISEYLAVDKYKITTTVVSNGKTTTTEEIQLRDIRYCKKDSSEWEVDCPMPPPIAAMGPVKGAKYFLQLGTETKTYERRYQTVRENKFKATKTPVTTIDKIILNIDSSKRDRSITSSHSETKEVLSRSTSKVEYGIKLYWIEAPGK